MPRNRLGSLEAAVMALVWDAASPLTIRQVVDALGPTRDVAYTTVSTVMDNLCRKNVLTREQVGRVYVFRARSSREDFIAELVGDALSDSPDPAGVLIRFTERLDEADVQRLAEALGSRRAQQGEETPG